MEHRFALLLVSLLSLYSVPGDAQTCSCPSNNGCSQSASTGRCEASSYVQGRADYTQGYYVNVLTRRIYDCGWISGGDCYESIYRTYLRYRTVEAYQQVHQCNFYCCSGYVASGSGCEPVCSSVCRNGGACIGPDHCRCVAGAWTGSDCTTPVCSPACVNGGACTAPGVCTCTYQWTGAGCGTPVCDPACQNGGTCTGYNTCSCTSSWQGALCNEALCSPACANGGQCESNNMCTCAAGWTGERCTQDVDECSNSTSPCEHQCTNTDGSYVCSCNAGYQLDSDGNSCVDADECFDQTDNCEQVCNNNVGSFSCSCYTGYVISTVNSNECDDTDECLQDPCDQTCANSEGSFECSCSEGFLLVRDTVCEDVDECLHYPCDHLCANNVGSYECSCEDGFTLTGQYECTDNDECADGSHACQQNCQNTVGTYECYCDAGFILSVDSHSCEEFSLGITDIVVQPVNLGFLDALRDGFQTCLNGSACECMHALFTALTDLGFTEEAPETTEEFFNVTLTDGRIPMSDLILSLFGFDSAVALPVLAYLKSFTFNCTDKMFTADTEYASGDLELFRGIMTVETIKLTIAIANFTTGPTIESLTLGGTFNFGNVTLDVTVEMSNPSMWTFETTLSTEENINVIGLMSSAIGVDLPQDPFDDLLLASGLSLSGYLDIEGNYTFALVLKGTVNIGEWLQEDFCVIVHHTASNIGRKKPQVGFITGCSTLGSEGSGTSGISESLTNIIRQLAGANLNSIPFFRDFQLPAFHVAYLTEDFLDNDLSLNLLDVALPAVNLSMLNVGNFTFLFDLPNLRTNQSHTWAFWKNGSFFNFNPLATDGFDFTLEDLILQISSAIEFPTMDLFSTNLNGVLMEAFNFDLMTRTLTLSINIPETISILFDEFTVGELTLDLDLNFYNLSSLVQAVNFQGIITLGSLSFDVSMGFDAGVYDLSACASVVDGGLGDVSSSLGNGADNPLAISSLGLGEIGLIDPCFVMQFTSGEPPEHICFSATLFRSEVGNAAISACVTKDKDWIFGFEITDFVIAKLLAKLIGSAGRRISLFNQQLDVAVLYTPISVENLPLQGVLLSEFEAGTIVEGTTIIAKTTWPEGCSSDPFCAVSQSFLGADAELYLIIHITGSTVSVSAEVKDFTIGSFQLSSASLQMQFGDDGVSIGIAAELILQEPPVTLIGSLSLEIPSVSFAMSMVGCWENAFGISILEICDLHFAVTITPGSALPGLAFGITAKIGRLPCYVYEISAYLGVNPADPLDNYFYLQMTRLTLQSILDMFCLSIDLPEFLLETGFPKGLHISYASKEHVLEQFGLVIPSGFYLKGTINIFGYEVEADVVLDPPRLIDVYVRLGPMNLAGGLLKMFESRTQRTRGPFMHVIVGTDPEVFSANASGYVSLLGLQQEAKLTVSNRGYYIYLFGDIWGVLTAEVEVTANFKNLLTAEFSVSAKLSISLLRKIQDAVVNAIRAAAEGAEQAISAAQDALNSAKDDFDRAAGKVREAAEDVAGSRGEVASFRNGLGKLRGSVCQYKSCSPVCVPFLCGCGCSTKVWGACVIPCLEWKECCFTIPDPLCLLYNAGCAILRAFLEFAILIAQGFLLIVEATLYIAEGFLRGVAALIEAAKVILDAAILVLEAVKFTVRVGLQAFEAVTKFLLTGLIDIQEIGFGLRLGLFTPIEVSAHVVVSLFGQSPVRIGGTLSIPNPLALAKDLAGEAVPGLGRKKRGVRSIHKVTWLAQHFKRTGGIYPKY